MNKVSKLKIPAGIIICLIFLYIFNINVGNANTGDNSSLLTNLINKVKTGWQSIHLKFRLPLTVAFSAICLRVIISE